LQHSLRHSVDRAFGFLALFTFLTTAAATAQTTQRPKPARPVPATSAPPAGATATQVTLALTSLAFGSQTEGTTSAPQTVAMTNSGTVALTITGITVTGANTGDFAEKNNCPESLAAGANCTIGVTFKPTATGTRTGAISIADNATGSPQTFTLTGTGAAVPEPTIKQVLVFPQDTSTASQGSTTQEFVLEIIGTGFESIDVSKVSIVLLPATSSKPAPIQALSLSQDKKTILAQFTAPTNYALGEIALFTGSTLLSQSIGALSCDFKSKATLIPQMVPKDQAGNKYGNGVAKNFYAVQVSIVNECPMAIIVPLGGIMVTANDKPPSSDVGVCGENGILVPYSLDHVTSIYSADRKLTGRRAIYFNTVQALATIGSAVEPFFAHGFTMGVAILGGGFTTASKEIFVDMSAEQLQNLTSQSFGSTEQVASHGSLQKFVFIRRNNKCQNGIIETDLRTGKFTVDWELSPASTESPKSLTATATATPATKTKSDTTQQN
jgi:hypothetical protein